ncbi:MAG: hypothetical protein JWP15_698 [Alphaproteobacteria bacterium]|nr:hypothetical protein [Alphaproteobacteria bacterium]
MRFSLFLCLCLAGCGQAVPVGSGADNQASPPDVVTAGATAVRIGELGPSLAACSASATTRHLEAGETLPVRSAPFDNGDQSGAVPSGGRFFVCSRSLDQKWFGIVYDDSFGLKPSCGVSDPVPVRRAYDGPCHSGWVSTPFVKLIAGNDLVVPATNQAAPDTNGAAAAAG